MFRSDPNSELARLQGFKSRSTTVGNPLGPELIGFFKQSVARRQTKLVKIAECWSVLVPETLNNHLRVGVAQPRYAYRHRRQLFASL